MREWARKIYTEKGFKRAASPMYSFGALFWSIVVCRFGAAFWPELNSFFLFCSLITIGLFRTRANANFLTRYISHPLKALYGPEIGPRSVKSFYGKTGNKNER